MQIQGQTFLVTGGSSGLGAACVRRLVGQGGHVVIVDVQKEAGEALAAELGSSAAFVQTDVTSEEAVQAAVDTAVSTYGALHGAINCAGIAIGERVLGARKAPSPRRLLVVSSKSTSLARSTSSASPAKRWPKTNRTQGASAG